MVQGQLALCLDTITQQHVLDVRLDWHIECLTEVATTCSRRSHVSGYMFGEFEAGPLQRRGKIAIADACWLKEVRFPDMKHLPFGLSAVKSNNFIPSDSFSASTIPQGPMRWPSSIS
jgi:hypothetical protein